MDVETDRRGSQTRGARATDSERERVAEALTQHFLDRRLTSNEYSERLDTAYTAQTREDLGAVLRDLPPMSAVPTRPQPTGP
jgi:hypothetical protein